MKAIRYSTEAHLDIKEIANYIFERNPGAADRFLAKLDETCELLAEHPLIGRLRSDIGQQIRSFAVGNFLVFYAPVPDGIDVARVVYGGRDLPSVFKL